MKVGTKVMSVFFKCGAGYCFLSYPPSSTTSINGASVYHVRSTQEQCKMADVVDIRPRQSVVTQFLIAEGSSPIEIHRRLRSVYDDMDVSSNAGFVILRLVKRTLLTDPAATDQPRQQRQLVYARWFGNDRRITI
jgi:hypothetical protein